MAVGSVSFGNSQAFADLIKKPQAYTAQTPSAATGIAGEKKKHTGVKIGVGLAAAAIAVVAGLVAGAKTGVFKFEKLQNNELVKKLKNPENLKKALEKMDEIGNQIADFGKGLWGKVKNLIPKAQETIQEAGENAGETIAAAAQEAIS